MKEKGIALLFAFVKCEVCTYAIIGAGKVLEKSEGLGIDLIGAVTDWTGAVIVWTGVVIAWTGAVIG